MTKFEAIVNYAGRRVRIEADTFAELHQALAGIEELNRDAEFLRRQGIEEVVPVYRKDGDENEYYGLQDRHSRRNITYGKKREKGIIPFFPKGEEGYYDPSDASRRAQRPAQAEPQRSRSSSSKRQRQRANTSVSDDLPF